MYRGANDLEIAEQLEIEISEWQEIKSVCSGPPLEINEHAKPTESLEPQEINFGEQYQQQAERAWNCLNAKQKKSIEDYFCGKTHTLPTQAVEEFIMNKREP